MTNSRRLAEVRARLLRWIADQAPSANSETRADAKATDEGLSPDSPVMRESILIRDGFYCGRRFHTDQHRAVWFIEEDELKIFDHQDRLLCVISGPAIDVREQSQESSPSILAMPQRAIRETNSGDTLRRAA
jgi:hypothetical protein